MTVGHTIFKVLGMIDTINKPTHINANPDTADAIITLIEDLHRRHIIAKHLEISGHMVVHNNNGDKSRRRHCLQPISNTILMIMQSDLHARNDYAK